MEQQSIFHSAVMRFLVPFAVVMVIFALFSYTLLNLGRLDNVDPMPAQITVNGVGEIAMVPDVGKFSFSVSAEGETAAEAQEASGVKINEIVAYLEEAGVAEKDIKTENYNLYPRYRYEERICPMGSYCPPGERVQDGFEASQMITVTVRETAEAGALIAGVGERGATNISNLDFTIDDIEALRDEARAAAIADAKAKGELLAEQLGVRITGIVGYYEDGGNAPYYYETRAMAMDMAEEGFGGAVTPVGEETTTVRVNITYEVQ